MLGLDDDRAPVPKTVPDAARFLPDDVRVPRLVGLRRACNALAAELPRVPGRKRGDAVPVVAGKEHLNPGHFSGQAH